jgi:hypothetical protein
MDISHDHIDLGPQIPFLGSDGLFSPLRPQRHIFSASILNSWVLIDGYITRPYWFWNPNSVFGLWSPIFSFMTPKSIYFLDLYNISDRLMGRIFEAPVPSLGILRIPNFKLQTSIYKMFWISEFLNLAFSEIFSIFWQLLLLTNNCVPWATLMFVLLNNINSIYISQFFVC